MKTHVIMLKLGTYVCNIYDDIPTKFEGERISIHRCRQKNMCLRSKHRGSFAPYHINLLLLCTVDFFPYELIPHLKSLKPTIAIID